ncbi:MAG: glycosyltransferase [Acidobacteria bacterium]|nr:glycosyltransferase [Acidobacteriota bacterium]MCI0627276.1 glycosyltransferase [Acidobacteriota bacterium]MCI0722914.1 glycosyltransferase [Acidobacteriota bacterium]
MTLTVIGPTHPFRGGIAHYTTLLVRSLRARQQVQFFSYSRQYPHWLYPGDTDLDPSTSLLTHEKPTLTFDALNPWAWRQLAGNVKISESPLVILPWSTVYWTPFYWLFLKSLGKEQRPKSVFICHNVMEHEAAWIKSAISRRALGCGDFFITHSKWDQDNLARWLGPSRARSILVCPHPSYEHLRQSPMSKAEARAALGIQSERVLLFFGFIREYKGLRYLIESLPQVRENLDVHLLIAGEVWGDAKPYRDLIASLGIASCVTFVRQYIPNEEVARYFAASDLVVIPYASATQSGIVQLAYGFGKPVVVSRVGGLPEAVEDGKTGYLVPPKDSESISRAVLDFYQNGREGEMAEAVRQKRSATSWERLCQTIEKLAEASKSL